MACKRCGSEDIETDEVNTRKSIHFCRVCPNYWEERHSRKKEIKPSSIELREIGGEMISVKIFDSIPSRDVRWTAKSKRKYWENIRDTRTLAHDTRIK
jgi:hypothetical protein